MWNKRNEDPRSINQVPGSQRVEPVRPEPAQAPPPPPPAVRESAPLPAREVMPQQPRQPASIGSGMVIVGEIYSKEDLFVDGEVEGKLELQSRLTVGPSGKVQASIKAREVVIIGNVQGDVDVTDKIAIRKNGSLIGNVRTAGIVIEDGAYFKGSIDIIKSPPIKQAAIEREPEPVAR